MDILGLKFRFLMAVITEDRHVLYESHAVFLLWMPLILYRDMARITTYIQCSVVIL